MSEKRIAASTPMRSDRLQRDLGAELGNRAHLPEGVLLPERPVLGQVPSGLRMIQTGVRSTGSPRQARRKISFIVTLLEC